MISAAVPTDPGTDIFGRIDALDAARGIAVCGIVLLNVYNFSMPPAAYFNPLAYGHTGIATLAIWAVESILAQDAFRAIFAMLFEGVGPPIVEVVDAMVAALQGWMRPVLVSGVVLYAVGRMIWATLRGDGNPFGDSLAIMISGSIFIYAATEAAGLGPQARNLLLNGVSNDIGRVLLRA